MKKEFTESQIQQIIKEEVANMLVNEGFWGDVKDTVGGAYNTVKNTLTGASKTARTALGNAAQSLTTRGVQAALLPIQGLITAAGSLDPQAYQEASEAFKRLQSALNKACKANGQQTVDAGKNAYANVQASAAQTKQGYNNIKNGVSNVYNNMANAYNGTGQQQTTDPTGMANSQQQQKQAVKVPGMPGNFGSNPENVKMAQMLVGETVDGKLGPRTRKAINTYMAKQKCDFAKFWQDAQEYAQTRQNVNALRSQNMQSQAQNTNNLKLNEEKLTALIKEEARKILDSRK